MLISDYLSSNIKISILFLFDPSNRARAEIQKYFRSIFGSNENFKTCFRNLLTFRYSHEKLQTIDAFHNISDFDAYVFSYWRHVS